ncbi:hypothetical protein [Pseudomonas segetis]|uniref:Phage-related minor tail protein n=1 Tax=Pseudomonas segetis TaxID=298908 RepID=A0A239JPQ4_9PSED|nr:hypothetical protein [Pseudomonas segetis]SNT07795.1 Phage-related minor tail protein [Pseudomonas segetis]
MAGDLRTSVILDLVDRISGPARRVTQALGRLARRAGLDGLVRSARGVQTALVRTIRHAVALGKGLAVVGGAAAAAGWAITRMVGGVATLGNEIKITSERLGVGAGWIQEWIYAGRQFSVEKDALIDGFKELSLRTDEFVVTGSGGAADAFGRLGITVKDLRATAGDTEKLLNLVQSRMGRIKNDAAKQRIFDELFGGSGGEQMVTLLTQSREQLDALRQAARDSGSILSDEDIEQSRRYVRQMDELSTSLGSIKTAVLSSLLPAVNQWLGGLRDLTKANRAMVTQQLLTGIKQLWTGLRAVGNAVAWVANLVGGFGNLIVILAGLLATKLVFSLGLTTIALVKFAWSMSVAAVKGVLSFSKTLLGMAARAIPAAIMGIRALSLALLTTPIGLIITGITALAGAVYLIYRNWDGISVWFGNLWVQIKAFFDRGIGDIAKDLLSFSPAGLLLKAVDAVFALFGARPLSEVGKEWIGGLWDGLRERFEPLTGWLKQKIATLSDWIVGGIGGIAKSLLSFSPVGLLVKAIDAVFELFGARPLSEVGEEWVGGLWDGIRGRFDQLTSWLKQKVTALSGWLPDWITNGSGISAQVGSITSPTKLVAPVASVAAATKLGAPAANAPLVPKLGDSAVAGRSMMLGNQGRTDVGGELRIKIDSEGRPRVASLKRNGGLDYSVESGTLGVVP